MKKKDTTIDNNTAKIVGEALKINKTLIEISLNRKNKKEKLFLIFGNFIINP